jgi:hypothetical protein
MKREKDAASNSRTSKHFIEMIFVPFATISIYFFLYKGCSELQNFLIEF